MLLKAAGFVSVVDLTLWTELSDVFCLEELSLVHIQLADDEEKHLYKRSIWHCWRADKEMHIVNIDAVLSSID